MPTIRHNLAAMLLIKKWLNGSQNFIVGKVLYNHFGNESSLRELFACGETPHAKNLLLKALQNIDDRNIHPEQQPATAPLSAMPNGTDRILQAIQNEWNPLYQEMNLLRHKLDQYGNDNTSFVRAERLALAEKILSLEQQVILIWAKRDYYLQYGKLPEEKTKQFVIPEDPLELARLYERLKKHIRKHKKNLKDNPGNATYAALLDKYESQLKLITDKHNVPGT